MNQKHILFKILRPVKQHVGYLVNRTTERRFGFHVSLQKTFPYAAISKHRFLSVRMDVINKCNLHCKMCYFSLGYIRNSPRTEMSLQLFRKIAADVFPCAKQLVLSAGAEPLLAKSFPEMLESVAQYHIPQITFVTNGMLLNRDNIEKIILAGVHIVVISFDGATSQTYEAIRRGARFERVVENIRLVQEIKHEFGSSIPHIHFSTVLMRKNIEELPDILLLAKELQVAHVGAAHLIPYIGLDVKSETLNNSKELTNLYLSKSRQLASQLGLSFEAPSNFSMPASQIPGEMSSSVSSERRCSWPWTEILINPEGRVYPCCYWYETTEMGNCEHQSFKEIWYSPEYKQLRRELATNTLRETCLHCPIGSGIPDCNDDRAFSEVKIRRGV